MWVFIRVPSFRRSEWQLGDTTSIHLDSLKDFGSGGTSSFKRSGLTLLKVICPKIRWFIVAFLLVISDYIYLFS